MTNNSFVVDANVRDELGTGSARLARRNGMIPAVVYGNGMSNLCVSLSAKEITKLYNSGRLFNTKIDLDLKEDKKSISVIVQDASFNPITDLVSHLDLLFLSKEWHDVKVPIKFFGTESSPGLKRGGFLNKVMRSALLRCPINNIPANVVCNVSSLAIGNKINAAAVEIPSDCTLVTSPDSIVASIIGKS
jgi:large subunit ribosomal protein L25